MSKILITAKISPDLDGLACAYSYAKLLNIVDKGNEYIAGIFGEPHVESKYLINTFSIRDGLIYNPKVEFDKFILVDASDLKGMPDVIRAEDVIEVIDHRETHRAAELFPNAKIQVEKVGAAATLILEKFTENKVSLDKESVYLLLGAIYSNTLNFLSDIVSERDINAVVILKNSNIDIPKNIISEMFSYKSDFISKNLEASIASDFKDFDNGLGIAQLEAYNLDKIVNDNITELKEIIKRLKEQYKLKYIFLTAIDLKNNYNVFVTIDEDTKLLLSKSMPLIFDGMGMARNNKMILRKQIVPLLVNNLKF